MGNLFSSSKEKYLGQEEIDRICGKNPTIEKVFNKHKNVDGVKFNFKNSF